MSVLLTNSRSPHNIGNVTKISRLIIINSTSIDSSILGQLICIFCIYYTYALMHFFQSSYAPSLPAPGHCIDPAKIGMEGS